ncbi:MAG: RNA-binding protein [Candidatus Aminicenantes bacterium]|nr:RNA-binding protein [Candidatus Aminicenantes bacterium]
MSSNKLYVGNLNYKTTEDVLRQVFVPFGEVISANILPHRGYGFVEMAMPEAAEEARLKLNGQELEGRKMIVNEAKPRAERPAESRFGQERRDFRKP